MEEEGKGEQVRRVEGGSEREDKFNKMERREKVGEGVG